MPTDKQIRLDCLSMALKGREGHPAAGVIAEAEALAAWVIGTPSDPDALAEAVEMLLPRLKQNRAGEWYLAGEKAQTDHIISALFLAADWRPL